MLYGLTFYSVYDIIFKYFKAVTLKLCEYGGIGRRAGFRCQSGQLGAGSTPVIRTHQTPRFFGEFSFI